MTNSISNRDDILDSRDIIQRIEELESERDTLQDAVDTAQEAYDEAKDDDVAAHANDLQAAQEAIKEYDESEEGEELKALHALAEQADGSRDWLRGEVLIRDSYFQEYARHLADDLGLLHDTNKWPHTCISPWPTRKRTCRRWWRHWNVSVIVPCAMLNRQS